MRPMTSVRRIHFDMLRFSVKTIAYIARSAPPAGLTTFSDGPAGWTSAEILGHLLDCDRLYLERARLTLTQDCPELPFPDQAEDVAKGRYNECDPFATLEAWRQAREEYIAFLNTVPDDASWEREGKPLKYPPFSLNDQLFLACWHDQVHIEQLTRILTEKVTAPA